MKIALACDHGGYPLKLTIEECATAMGHEVIDLVPKNTPGDDYPDFAERLGRSIIDGQAELGGYHGPVWRNIIGILTVFAHGLPCGCCLDVVWNGCPESNLTVFISINLTAVTMPVHFVPHARPVLEYTSNNIE